MQNAKQQKLTSLMTYSCLQIKGNFILGSGGVITFFCSHVKKEGSLTKKTPKCVYGAFPKNTYNLKLNKDT